MHYYTKPLVFCMKLQLESCSELFCLSLVAWLVERIHAKNVTADTTGLLEEIEEGTEVLRIAFDEHRAVALFYSNHSLH